MLYNSPFTVFLCQRIADMPVVMNALSAAEDGCDGFKPKPGQVLLLTLE
jgi:hypothetical protein